MTTRRRLPSADSFWLELDQPENLMVVTSLMWTSEKVAPDRLRAVVQRRLVDRYPVFRQRPLVSHGPIRHGKWVDDPDFDLDRHLAVRAAPGAGDRAALQAFVGEQRATPLDPEHSPWRMWLLQGYQGGSAVVTRFHHCIADGIRSTQVMLDLLDPAGDRTADLAARVGAPVPVSARPGPVAAVSALLNSVGSVVKLLLWTNPPSALEGRPGIGKAVAWSDPVPLAVLKGIAAPSGTTINDVCTALVSGAMARYLARTPGPRLLRNDDDVAWMVPVNLEPAGRRPPPNLGNHFALALLVLPHGPAPFAERLAEVHRRMGRIRNSWEPELTFALSRTIAVFPAPLGAAAIRFFAAKAVGVLTNVPGPREAMTLAGAPVAGVVGWAPTSVRQALTVTIFSYAGQVTFGFGTDRSVVPDPAALVAALAAELAAATEGTPVQVSATAG